MVVEEVEGGSAAWAAVSTACMRCVFRDGGGPDDVSAPFALNDAGALRVYGFAKPVAAVPLVVVEVAGVAVPVGIFTCSSEESRFFVGDAGNEAGRLVAAAGEFEAFVLGVDC